MTYTCWQCGVEFERENDEWRCPACMDAPEDLEVPKPQCKGGGFFAPSN